MDGPRKANGDLPDTDFLRPAGTSKLIDAGLNVGLPFSGNKPDIGAFEYETEPSVGCRDAVYLRQTFRFSTNDLSYVFAKAENDHVRQICITDASGRMVLRQKFTDATLSVSRRALPQGILIIRTEPTVRRFVIFN